MPICPTCNTEIDPLTAACPRCTPPQAIPSPPPPMAYTTTAPVPTVNNDMATASLVLGILGFCTGGLGGLVGIILGLVALSQINASQGRMKGHGIAIGGIITSGIAIFVGFFLAVVMLIAVPHAAAKKKNDREKAMVDNLNNIRVALEQFDVVAGQYPQSLDDLIATTPPPYLKPGQYHGPYLKNRPMNPLVPQNLPIETHNRPSDPPVAHWSYEPTSGRVWPGNTGITTYDGRRYEDL